MNPALISALLSVQLLVPVTPAMFQSAPRTPAPFDTQALRAHVDPSLESLRAGRTTAPSLLDVGERAALQQAHLAGADLADLRAAGLTDEQWTWVAIGALVIIVLLLI